MRFSDIRYELRGLIAQAIGYCEVLLQQPSTPESAQLLAGIEDFLGIAKSIGTSLDATRLNSRQLENLGRRVLTLSSHIGSRSVDLMRLASQLGQRQTTTDLDRLHTVASALLPFAKELILNHESLAADQPSTADPSQRATPAVKESAVDRFTSPLLVVDDNEGNRELLARRLGRAGYSAVKIARNGREALELLGEHPFDLVLLDVMMPDIDGIGVLSAMKNDERLRDIPVVMISAVDDASSVAQCIELGADDYLPKPFDQTILQARIRGSIERKLLRDAERHRTEDLERALSEINKARQVSEDLLRNILPGAVAEELLEKNAVDPMYFEDVTIVFTDFVGFTVSTETLSAEELVHLLNAYFTGMDRITERYGLEKLKTIGDSYMFVAGLPERNPAHPVDAVLAAFEILEFVSEMRRSGKGADWSIRIGVHTGPAIAGVVGVKKFAFDIWGDSVNIASRIESGGASDRVSLSERTYSRVKDFFVCEHGSKVRTKDGYHLDIYNAVAIQPKLLVEAGNVPPAFARRYSTYFKREIREFPPVLRQPPEQA